MDVDLGIDAGGTKAEWLALDAAGQAVAQGAVAGIQAAALEPAVVAERLAAIVAAAASAAGGAVHTAVAGLAGAGRPAVRRAIRAALPGGGPSWAIVGDVEVAAAASLAERAGLVVQSGTGSFAVARDAGGRLHRAGGRGHLLDDRGGAYAIVRAAAAAAVEAADGVGPTTSLGELLALRFGAGSPLELGAVLQALSPRDLAAALPLVLDAAQQGDEVAASVLVTEARALAQRALAAARRAGLSLPDTPLAFGGGVLSNSPRYAAVLAAALGALGFAHPTTPAPAAVLGAARLARALRLGALPLAGWISDERAA